MRGAWPDTRHCSYCYHSFQHKVIEVGHWWKNSPDLAVVCSDTCKDKLWKLVEDRTWMLYKPPVMFPEATHGVKGPTAITDKQFGL